jgi:UDP-2,4-diacetamido-2,4,6-trideoxy-beta-L-altropyranose hydrolase
MNVLIRVDSSSEIGLGHLMRCLVLAEQYQQDTVIFACQDLDGNANQRIIEKGYKVEILNNNSIGTLCNIVKFLNINNIIFDHYGIDNKFEKVVKEETGIHILSFDDTYEKHYCDVLLNHNIYANSKKYKNLVPDFCEIRCGKKYTLIRKEFKEVKVKRRKFNKENLVVLVSLGGADVNNVSLDVLKVMVEFNNITINLATTDSNKNIGELIFFSKKHKNVNICVDCKISKLMNESDFAIITPSVIVHEAMAMHLPFIAIMTASNQKIMHKYLYDNDYLVLNQSVSEELQRQVIKLSCHDLMYYCN